jgi:serine/threonine protein kinase
MAEVWMAHRTSLGARKTVAIKLLAPNLARKPVYRKMFLEEARLSMLLNNARLVHVFDAGEYPGGCYIAMEWIDGLNLAELQTSLWERGQRLPIDVAMFITGEVLRALHYAHNLVHEGASGIVHRDVSPQNVMLSMAGEVKLADFGVARFSSEETTGLHVKGKLRYMPLEQFQGSSREVTVDVFAVGAILHEMLEGEKFRGISADCDQLRSMVLAGMSPELSDPSRVPPALDALRRGLLMPDPSQRIASAVAALQLLQDCPGYHDMSLDLEALVREHRAQAPSDPSGGQGHRTGSIARRAMAMPEYQTKDTSVSRRVRHSENPATGTERRKSFPIMIPRERQKIAAVAIALAGLAVGSLSIGIANQGILADPNQPEVAEASFAGMDWAQFDGVRDAVIPDERPQSEPPPSEPKAKPAAGRRRGKLPSQLAKSKPRESADAMKPPAPKAAPTPELQGPPVKVLIAAGNFTSLDLKIGSKIYMLEPAKEVKLSPGRHKLRIREIGQDKWQSITVDIPKKPCRVVFKRPGTALVTPL